MFDSDTDLLFPPRILPDLRDLRDEPWQELVATVCAAGPHSLEQIAFVLMMARMNNCASCHSDSYRAMNGCSLSTQQSLKRFNENDHKLVALFHKALGEVEDNFRKKTSEPQ
jgi:hypothetical protein